MSHRVVIADDEPNLVTGIQVQDDGTSTVTRDVAAECFFHDCEPAATAAALRTWCCST